MIKENFEKEDERLKIISIASHLKSEFLADVLECFSQKPHTKSLPFWWLYDELGSKIFEGFKYLPLFLPKIFLKSQKSQQSLSITLQTVSSQSSLRIPRIW